MAKAVTFDARIINKHGTLQQWLAKKDAVLLKGEIAVAEVTGNDLGAEYVLGDFPAYLLKVGDGKTAFTDLPWLAAKAADVYEWAKQPKKPAYTTGEIADFQSAVTKLIQGLDQDTQFRLVQDDSRMAAEHILTVKLQKAPRGGKEYTDVEGSSIPVSIYDDTRLTQRVAALEGKVGSASVGDQITGQVEETTQALRKEMQGLEAELATKQKALVFADSGQYPYSGAEAGKYAVTDGWVSAQISAGISKSAEAQNAEIGKKQNTLKWAGETPYGDPGNLAVSEKYLSSSIGQTEEALRGEIGEARAEVQESLSEARSSLEGQIGETRTDLEGKLGQAQEALEESIGQTADDFQAALDRTAEALRAELSAGLSAGEGDLQGSFSNELGAAVTELRGEIETGDQTTKEELTEQFRSELEEARADLEAAQRDLENRLDEQKGSLQWAGEEEDRYDGALSKAVASAYLEKRITEARGEVSQEIDVDVRGLRDETNEELARKQDSLSFAGDQYNPMSNRVATESYVDGQLSKLSGALIWRGAKESIPNGDESGTYKLGDVVTVSGTEYAYDGTAWQEMGDEDKYSAQVPGWDTAAKQAHTHANAAQLDQVTADALTKWNAAEANAKAYTDKKTLADLQPNTEYVVLDCGNSET